MALAQQINASAAQSLCEKIKMNINRIMIGKDKTIDSLLIALAASGHVLLEDVPGIGKTTLIKALARSLALDFKRIQFTPDLMPSDITGFSIYNQKTGDFEFQKGAIMAQMVLADEINRSSPKTQSALLEVMQEQQVSVDGVTYQLPNPFLVMATQNPVEQLGTYPLPEAQLDRFMLKISMGYPTIDEEVEILNVCSSDHPMESIQAIAGPNEVNWLRAQAQGVHCSDSVKVYIAQIMADTRRHPDVKLGASPRASTMLMNAAKARALLQGRDYTRPDDVQAMATSVLGHRLTLYPEAKLQRISEQTIIGEILQRVPVPVR